MSLESILQKGGEYNMADENVPSGQKFYDNLLLLFILGFVVLVVSYTGWGLVEIFTTPSLPK